MCHKKSSIGRYWITDLVIIKQFTNNFKYLVVIFYKQNPIALAIAFYNNSTTGYGSSLL